MTSRQPMRSRATTSAGRVKMAGGRTWRGVLTLGVDWARSPIHAADSDLRFEAQCPAWR